MPRYFKGPEGELVVLENTDVPPQLEEISVQQYIAELQRLEDLEEQRRLEAELAADPTRQEVEEDYVQRITQLELLIDELNRRQSDILAVFRRAGLDPDA